MSQSEFPLPPGADDDYVSKRMRRARALLRNVMRVNRELEREMLRQINEAPAAESVAPAARGKRK